MRKDLTFAKTLREPSPEEVQRKLVNQKRKARNGVNPKTGAKIKIPAKTVVKFRVAKAAKDAILGQRISWSPLPLASRKGFLLDDLTCGNSDRDRKTG